MVSTPRSSRISSNGAERRFLDVGEDDAHAVGGETLGEAAADAAGGAGDDGDFVLEVFHDAVLPDALILRKGTFDGGLREDAADLGGIDDAADGEDVGGLAHGAGFGVADGGDFGVGVIEEALEARVDLVLLPEEGLQVLHPLEVGDDDAAGVGEDVRARRRRRCRGGWRRPRGWSGRWRLR